MHELHQRNVVLTPVNEKIKSKKEAELSKKVFCIMDY